MQTAENFRPNALTTGILLLASTLLIPGLFLPALETRHLGLWDDQHSILSLGVALVREKEWLLAGTVLGFSVGFPLTKIVWMWRIQLSKDSQPPTSASLRWLERLGKWSMADVLVIALVVFSLRGSFLMEARPLIGAGCFALSAVLAMIAAGRIVDRGRG
ncbi:paraquat-inducible protein A [uncultured Maricaulis sp.]|uniref:paraquat-inducible protein A n=1 Tax=uncultured Maricaulis sp. TaxID=174710 RepID=UPI00260670FE|nr:paraquat-inducible protein A [uncultured Maricaulis sp.]